MSVLRIVLQSASFKPLGEISSFPRRALSLRFTREGVHVPNDRMDSPFRAITVGGSVNWDRRAVPQIPLHRVRQVLLDDRTLSERIREFAKKTYPALEQRYQSLGWVKAPFWPALSLAHRDRRGDQHMAFCAVPARTWAMPRVGSAADPDVEMARCSFNPSSDFFWHYLLPIEGLAAQELDALYEQNFVGRAPVKEREKYCVLSLEADIAAFARDLSAEGGARIWIAGVGGKRQERPVVPHGADCKRQQYFRAVAGSCSRRLGRRLTFRPCRSVAL